MLGCIRISSSISVGSSRGSSTATTTTTITTNAAPVLPTPLDGVGHASVSHQPARDTSFCVCTFRSGVLFLPSSSSSSSNRNTSRCSTFCSRRCCFWRGCGRQHTGTLETTVLLPRPPRPSFLSLHAFVHTRARRHTHTHTHRCAHACSILSILSLEAAPLPAPAPSLHCSLPPSTVRGRLAVNPLDR